MGEKGAADRAEDTALGNDAAMADQRGTVSSIECVSGVQISPALLNSVVQKKYDNIYIKI